MKDRITPDDIVPSENDKRQKELEKQALKKAYEDLDALIYTLTHELKSPAREIELYAEFIEEDNRDRLHPQSVKDIRSIRDTCENIITLVRLMMDYSRAGFKVMEKKVRRKRSGSVLMNRSVDMTIVTSSSTWTRFRNCTGICS